VKWGWIPDHAGELLAITLLHLRMTGTAVLFGLVIALPLGLLAFRVPRLRSAVLGVSNLLFTIPSVALFTLLLPVTGLTPTTVIVGLTAYTLVVLVRNTVEGLESVPPKVAEAARAMGYDRVRTLLTVELPLALPVIMAGLRIATVMTISLVSVGLVIGQGALGQLFVDGFQRDFGVPIIAGVVITLLLALLADGVLIGLQRVLTPWRRTGR
jgi:osmoprotectant transport system permease protein